MATKNYTRVFRKLAERAAAIEQERSSLEQRRQGLVSEAATATKKASVAQETLSDMAIELERIRMARVVASGIPEQVDLLRQMVIASQARAIRGDITVTEEKHLRTEHIPALLAQMQAVCQHPLVRGYTGYEGSYIHDRDDRYPGCRWCEVCLVDEYSTSDSREDYKVLADRDDRIVGMAQRADKHVGFLLPVPLPLEEVQELFIVEWRLYRELGLPEKK